MAESPRRTFYFTGTERADLKSAMEGEIAEEDKDCTLEEGNELCDMRRANEFTSFRGFECVLSAECNLVSSGETVFGS